MEKEISRELLKAEDLLYRCKFKDVQEIIRKLETKCDEFSVEYLSILLLKGRLSFYMEKYRKTSEIGEIAYRLSLKINKMSYYLDALLIKSSMMFLGKLTESKQIIDELESLFEKHKENPTLNLERQYSDYLLMKAVIYHNAADIDKAHESINQWMSDNQVGAKKLDLARAYIILGNVFMYKNQPENALENFNISLDIHTKLENQKGIATSLQYLALGYYNLGNLHQSEMLCKKSLSTPNISIFTTSTSLHLLGVIHKERGELNKALRIYKRVAKIRDFEQYFEEYLTIVLAMGTIYRMQGKYNLALEHFLTCYQECTKINSFYGIGLSLFYLILTNLDKENIKQAQSFLSEFKEVVVQTKSETFNNVFLIAKALILRKSNRMREKTEAEIILKEVIQKDTLQPQLLLLSIANLCDLLLYEMKIMENEEIHQEINPLIKKMLSISKTQHSYLWLAETKLLQAKLSLVKMDIRGAKKFMTEAQRIAEMHNLKLLAQRISYDHDSLLDQSVLWDELLKSSAPLSDRVKLASVNGVLGRMQGKYVIDPPVLVKEESKLLLIMSKDGIPHFTHSFEASKEYEPLFSSFLSAFNSFGSELFADSIDRINIGEYRIINNHQENFLFCYVFKGQSYPAKEKLRKFTQGVRNDPVIWNTLQLSVKTGRMLEMHNPPALGELVKQIFYEA